MRKRIALNTVIGIILLLILPAALTLRSVKYPAELQFISDNPTPLGYTWSLLLFIIPLIGIAFWFFRNPEYHTQKKAFFWTAAILISLAFILNIFFGSLFFIYPNEHAVIGIEVPVVGGAIPIEDFIFYVTGFLLILLTYIWSAEYWFRAYSISDHALRARELDKIIRFDLRALLIGVVLFSLSIVYKKFFSSVPEGFPGYFTYLLVVSIIPSSAFLSSVSAFINWRALSFTCFALTLISLIWEVTLAIPYGWWGFNPEMMIGLFIGAWWGLPVEEVVLWIMGTFTTVIAFEVIQIFLETDKKLIEAFFGTGK